MGGGDRDGRRAGRGQGAGVAGGSVVGLGSGGPSRGASRRAAGGPGGPSETRTLDSDAAQALLVSPTRQAAREATSAGPSSPQPPPGGAPRVAPSRFCRHARARLSESVTVRPASAGRAESVSRRHPSHASESAGLHYPSPAPPLRPTRMAGIQVRVGPVGRRRGIRVPRRPSRPRHAPSARPARHAPERPQPPSLAPRPCPGARVAVTAESGGVTERLETSGGVQERVGRGE
jgi:hypothetical protein